MANWEPSETAIKAKEYYKAGLWPKSRIDALLKAKKITAAEYEWILSD